MSVPASGQRTAGPVNALVFSPNGSRLYTAAYGRVVARDGKTGATIHAWSCPLEQIHGLALSADGRSIAAAGGRPGLSGGAVILDTSSGRIVKRLSGGSDLSMAVAHLPAGRIALACADKTLRIFGTAERHARSAQGHTGPLLALAVDPKCALIATAGADRTIRLWEAEMLTPKGVLAQHTETVNCLAFRPTEAGDPVLASGSDDGTVRIWQPGIGRMVRIVRGHDGRVLSVAYSLDGRRLFSGCSDGRVREIDPDSDRIVRSWKITDSWVHAIAVSPDGTRVAAGDSNGKVTVFSIGPPVTLGRSARSGR